MMIARKGITPVIATVLLLMMTVAAAGLAYTWVMGIQTQAQAGITTQMQQQQQAAQSSIAIDSVWNESIGTTGTLAFSLKNTGAYTFLVSEVNNFKLYIDGKPADASVSTLDGKAQTIGKPGFQSYTLSLTAGGTIVVNMTSPVWSGTAGTIRIIRVVPPFGTEAMYTCSIRIDKQQYC